MPLDNLERLVERKQLSRHEPMRREVENRLATARAFRDAANLRGTPERVDPPSRGLADRLRRGLSNRFLHAGKSRRHDRPQGGIFSDSLEASGPVIGGPLS